MTGLSRLNGRVVRALGLLVRQARSSAAVETSLVWIIPPDKTSLYVQWDLLDADQLDPMKVSTIRLLYSLDGGDTWINGGWGTSPGSNSAARQAHLLDPDRAQPWMRFNAPPAGALVKIECEAGGQPITTGALVRVA